MTEEQTNQMITDAVKRVRAAWKLYEREQARAEVWARMADLHQQLKREEALRARVASLWSIRPSC